MKRSFFQIFENFAFFLGEFLFRLRRASANEPH